MECIFCQIVQKKVPAQIVYEDEEILAFKDIQPKAKIHLLIIPKKHFVSLNEIGEKEKELLSRLLWQAKILAREFKISTIGYKIIINSGREAGQMIDHLHLHFLSGEELKNFTI
ncbi:MAG: histidine triad nucleotide-binding protein [Patescibacteria group bacterium]|nr:histidine triad nucleotide-binding protein [Patescibacteria group bacterium]